MTCNRTPSTVPRARWRSGFFLKISVRVFYRSATSHLRPIVVQMAELINFYSLHPVPMISIYRPVLKHLVEKLTSHMRDIFGRLPLPTNFANVVQGKRDLHTRNLLQVQHRERHCGVYQERVRQKVQPDMALYRRPQLWLVRDARDEALHLLLPGSGGTAAVQERLSGPRGALSSRRVCRARVFRDPVRPCILPIIVPCESVLCLTNM